MARSVAYQFPITDLLPIEIVDCPIAIADLPMCLPLPIADFTLPML
jgi:hypothetical protein